ncbi:zinc-dependent alcohol dehydrogenase family protein [Andreprevotia chitinilytica]|uniref:zinc-dependent alcohol dehydrogenase family protein n=1 Tax=Andreprevotia chitinilytica TaxID=396808 RepID=UPI0005544689|nr:NAD(P)-dependent alcohol dehydrogenase [Andreprevotia chitinilytica]
MSKTMQRWVMKDYGAQYLALDDAPIPQPGPGEVLVKVSAVSINFRDKLIVASGMGMPLKWPHTPGSDMAGEVVGTGPGVSRVNVGERVISTFWSQWFDGAAPFGVEALGSTLQGVLAEYVVLPQEDVVRAPQTLNDTEASTLTCAGLTAWFALVETGRLHAGQTIVVQGTGGFALFAVQLAVAHGARVIVTSSSDEKLARAKALGAVHGINRRTHPDWAEQVLRLTDGRGADHVLEMAGGDNLAQSVRATAPGGRISAVGVLDESKIENPVYRPILAKRLTLQGISVGHRRALEDLVQAVDRIGIKPVIDAEYAFADLPKALAHLDRGGFGKIVVRVAS